MTSLTLQRSKAANGIAYHRSGQGAPVVLVHGVGLRAESWFPQIEALQTSYTVYAIDMPGHGQSARLEAETPGLADYTARLADFVKAAVGEAVMLAGHSMGAMVALDFAARYPDRCHGVATLNAIRGRAKAAAAAVRQRAAIIRADGGQDLATGPLERWFGQNPSGPDRATAALCAQWLKDLDRQGYAAAYSVFAQEDGPSEAALGALAMPALFLTGADDGNSTPAMSEAMAHAAPRGEAVIVRGARHMAQLTHAVEVNAAMRGFFARCGETLPGMQPAGTLGG